MNQRQAPRPEHSQTTAEMMAAYQASQSSGPSDDGRLGWAYLFVVAGLFVGLIFLAWSCGDTDTATGGLDIEDLPAASGDDASDTTAASDSGDGVTDSSAESTPTTEQQISSAVLQTQVDELLAETKILFSPNEATIAEGESVLTDVVEAIGDTNFALRVEGYTDSVGDAEDNLALSEDRAETVKDALVELGIAETRITTEGFGEEQAVADNPTDEQKEADRRIEIKIVG